ncbi:hypothetical protein JTP67_06415 [Streptomyces sp. S12]|nr:hypothetical protein [Streptomyces sp. S12]
MTVHIDGVRIAIMAVGCLIGYFVFKHSTNTHPGLPATRGDVVGAITAACAVITVLMLLFGDVGESEQTGNMPPEVHPTSAVTTWPLSPPAQRS